MTFSYILIFGLPIAAISFSIWVFAVKIIDLKKQVDGFQAALFTLERNTNDKTKELQIKLDDLTALKIEDLTDALTAVSDLTPKQKLSRLARAKHVTTIAFEIVKNYGTATPLHEKTQKLMLLLLECAEKLAQAQLVAEGGKREFERVGVVSPSDRGEDGELLIFDKKNPWWPSTKQTQIK